MCIRDSRQFPFVAEQVLEVVVAPLRWRGGPGDLYAAGDRVSALARAKGAPPAQGLLLDRGCLGIGPHMGLRASAMGFAKGVAAGNQSDGFFVIHRHATKSLADVLGRRDRVRVTVRALRVDVDQP